MTAEKVHISRHIKADTSRMLWGVSAGMCEFRGCPNRLYKHHVTKHNVNLSEQAHIYAFSEGGKRFSRLLPRAKINDIDNLMLVCGSCHKLIDSDDTDYSAQELLDMKREHEERIRLLTSIKPDLQSEVVIYNCNIGAREIRINDFVAMKSIIPEYYPARDVPINLSPDLQLFDSEDDFWHVMSTDLNRRIAQYESHIRDKHVSLFAAAPQPLLFLLGTILNRNYNLEVRQSQGDISDWCWSSNCQTIELSTDLLQAEGFSDRVALTFELTARLSEDELKSIFPGQKIYRIVANKCSLMSIKSKEDLLVVMQAYRETLNRIRLECSADVQLSILPIAPASVSIEAGRQLMKGDPDVILYDRNFITKEWTATQVQIRKECKENDKQRVGV